MTIFSNWAEIQLEIPLRTLYDEPTIARLAAHISKLHPPLSYSGQVDKAEIPKVESKSANLENIKRILLSQIETMSELIARQQELLNELNGIAAAGSFPSPETALKDRFFLSESQKEIMILSKMNPEIAASFHVMSVLKIKESPDLKIMRDAFRIVAQRHESLRMVIEDNGERQIILESFEPDIPLVKISGHDPADIEQKTIRWLKEERGRTFETGRRPLWRVYILKTGRDSHLLVVTAHHLIADGWSFHILLDEAGALYTSLQQGESRPMKKPMQYREFEEKYKQRRESQEMESHETYWLNRLSAAFPIPELPVDFSRPQTMTYGGACWSSDIEPGLCTELKNLSRLYGCTLFMTLLAGFSAVLHRLTGQDDLMIGIDTNGRPFKNSERVIGNCTFILPIISRAAGNPTAAQHLASLRESVLGAFEHQDYTLTMLLDKLKIPMDPGRPFKIAASFNMQHQKGGKSIFEQDFHLQARSVTHSLSELTVDAAAVGDRIRLNFIYNKALFAEATIIRFTEYYINMLKNMTTAPNRSIFHLPILSRSEKRKLLVEWNNTGEEGATYRKNFRQLFEDQVRKTPGSVAVVSETGQITYGELNSQANRLAFYLVKAGAPLCITALLANRENNYLIAMLAIFKSDGVYLPLDPRDPDERLRSMLEQSGVSLILVSGEFRPLISQALRKTGKEKRPRVLNLETGLRQDRKTTDPPSRGRPLDWPAYVIYTSGSTGKPKGAIVDQRGMLNHLRAKISSLELTERDRVAQTASQCFDISLWQFLAPLLVGGSVRVIGDMAVHDPALLLKEIDNEKITIFETVPSMLRDLLEEKILLEPARPKLLSLRWVIPTGEPLPPQLCRRWISYYPDIPLLNAYGPTECSDDVTHHPIYWPPEASAAYVPIGRPITGAKLYVLDSRLRPVPTGTTGELYVGGVCVGTGYLNDPERTAVAFLPNPFETNDRGRIYKTGDLVRYLADGNLIFLGRSDQQRKIQGIRVEPAEVEETLQLHPAVRESVVVVRERETDDLFLAAYVAFRDGSSPTEGELRYFLRSRLPRYMVPAAITVLEALPLNANGKVDTGALPQPKRREPGINGAQMPPRNTVEKKLVDIWSKLLKQEKIGIHDDFFELGGRSLDAVRLASQVSDAFRKKMPVSTIYREPTVSGMATYLEATAVSPVSSPAF
jgi:amino acid adenylation domain-containing protein